MSEDKIIKPAFAGREEMPTELSACDFQRKLYDWFEERGLLTDLRAHLRKQMIGVLKDTAIGRTVSGHQRPTISPKLQAINLLTAEFLLQQDYHYSLSVFSTEVPLINVFPQLTGGAIRHPPTHKYWKFNEKDAVDILETLGMERSTEEAKTILSTYFKSTRDSMLSCIILIFGLIRKKSKSIQKTEKEQNKGNDPAIDHDHTWKKAVTEMLLSYKVNSLCIEDILSFLKHILESEKRRTQEEMRKTYVKMQDSLQQKIKEREESQNMKLAEIQNLLEVENRKKQKRQLELKNFAANVQRHNKYLKDCYRQVNEKQKELEERKKKLDEQEALLKSQQVKLDTSYTKLFEEQKTVIDLQEKLQETMQEKAKDKDIKFYQTIKAECQDIKTQLDETHEALTNNTKPTLSRAEIQALKAEMDKIRLENDQLKAVNQNQKEKINGLSQQASNLIRNLEITQTAIGFLNNGGSLTSAVVNTPSRPVSSASSRNRPVLRNGTTYSGAGEEIYRTTSTREYKSLLDRHEYKRKVPQRQLTVHSSSISEDFTNSIIEEAHERLKLLEQESQEVDRRYKEFKKSQERYVESQYRPKVQLTRNTNATPSATSSVLKPSTTQYSSYYPSVEVKTETTDHGESDHHHYGDEDREVASQSAASSINVLEMLAARASSVSMSDLEITDGEKSEDKTSKSKSEDD